MNHRKFQIGFLSLILALGLLYLICFNQSRHDFSSNEIKYVYFDLGANNGDSIDNFLGLSEEAKGGNIRSMFPEWFTNKKWIIHAFEANKLFNDKLIEKKYRAEKMGHTVHIYKETAAWIYDGKINFYLDTINKDNDYWSSSLNKNHPDVIASNLTKVQVMCVDLCRIIKQYKPSDIIVVKMDIEGAEYQLILDFIKKDAIKFIDYIAVEYHFLLSPYRTPEDVYTALISSFGIKFLEWT